MGNVPLKELPANHDMAHLERALGFVDNFGVAIDGGAHQGIWTRRMLELFDRVIAFEPVESNRRFIPSGATVYPYALGDKSGTAAMKPGPENTGQFHIDDGCSVSVVTLDSFNIVCDFLKLDVEGYELHALMGAENLIKRCNPVILIEDNGLCVRYGVEPLEADKWLKRIGYKCVARCNKDYIYKWLN